MPKSIKYLLFYFSSLTILVSCQGHSNKVKVSTLDSIKTTHPVARMHRNPNAPPTNALRVPIVIANYKTKLFKRSFDYMPTVFYPCLYIGAISDTIALNYPAKIGQFLIGGPPKGFLKGYYDSSLVQILVDTSQTLLTPIIPRPIPSPHNKSQLPPAYLSHPVFIMNYSSDTIQIGTGYPGFHTDVVDNSWILCLMEGVDSIGEWNLIEHLQFRMCGTGLENVMLPPNNIAITTMPIYEGTYKTRLHLTSCLDANSNVFYGSINKHQFQPEPGESSAKNPFRKRLHQQK